MIGKIIGGKKRKKRRTDLRVKDIEKIQSRLVDYGFPVIITGELDKRTMTVIDSLRESFNSCEQLDLQQKCVIAIAKTEDPETYRMYKKLRRRGRVLQEIMIRDIFGEFRHIFNI